MDRNQGCYYHFSVRPRMKPEVRRYPAFNVRVAKTDCTDLEELAVRLALPSVFRLLVEMVQEIVHLCRSSPLSLPANSRLLQVRSNRENRTLYQRLARANLQRPLSKAESVPLKISFPAITRAAVGTLSGTLRWSDGQMVLALIQTFCELAGQIEGIEQAPASILRYRGLAQGMPLDLGASPSPLSAHLFSESTTEFEPASEPPTSVRLVQSDLRTLKSLARGLGVRTVNRLVVEITLEVYHLCCSPPFRLGKYRRLLKAKISQNDQAIWCQLAHGNILRTVPNAKSRPIRISFPGSTRSKIAQLGDELGWREGQVIVESIQTFCLLAGAIDADPMPGILRLVWIPRSYSQRTDAHSGTMIASELNRLLGLVPPPSRLEQPPTLEPIILEGGLFNDG